MEREAQYRFFFLVGWGRFRGRLGLGRAGGEMGAVRSFRMESLSG
ncbi:MAG: hypothetical protein Q4D16_24680 [Eubacteriales bacterium]|nr:hypothetical protein [Eubacteriales bacterium]